MSTSMRDQLLKAGLINKKQANDAERQQRHERHGAPKRQPEASAERPKAQAHQVAQSAKVARDQELNRRQREKAERKARQAQVKQLIDQNRLPALEEGESYNFIDGSKIRRIGINASLRERLLRGEIVIVGHAGRYDLIPADVAARVRERDEHTFIASGEIPASSPVDDAYSAYKVPDDLIW